MKHRLFKDGFRPAIRAMATASLGLLLGAATLFPPTARAQVGSAVGAGLGDYRAFQHGDPHHPQPLQLRPDATIGGDTRVLGLVEITVSGPHAGATRILGEHGIEQRPDHDILLVPVVTAETLGDTPVASTRHADGTALTVDEARQVQPLATTVATTLRSASERPTLKVFDRAEQAALPTVPGAKALLPYGFATPNFAPNGPGTPGLTFLLPATITPLDDLDIVFAVIDTTTP